MLFVRSLTAGAVTGNFTQKDDIIENQWCPYVAVEQKVANC